MAEAEAARRELGRRTILFVDEIHRFNKAQQDAFLPRVEAGDLVLIGATTENPSFEVNAALLSRSKVFVLQPLATEETAAILRRALDDAERGLGGAGIAADDDALESHRPPRERRRAGGAEPAGAGRHAGGPTGIPRSRRRARRRRYDGRRRRDRQPEPRQRRDGRPGPRQRRDGRRRRGPSRAPRDRPGRRSRTGRSDPDGSTGQAAVARHPEARPALRQVGRGALQPHLGAAQVAPQQRSGRRRLLAGAHAGGGRGAAVHRAPPRPLRLRGRRQRRPERPDGGRRGQGGGALHRDAGGQHGAGAGRHLPGHRAQEQRRLRRLQPGRRRRASSRWPSRCRFICATRRPG